MKVTPSRSDPAPFSLYFTLSPIETIVHGNFEDFATKKGFLFDNNRVNQFNSI